MKYVDQTLQFDQPAGLPVAASSPHFFGREELYKDTIDGLHPTYDQHVSYIILEPTLGIPIRQCAKSQSNLVIPNLRGLSIDLARFSDMVLPLFWLQYVRILYINRI